MTHKTFLLLALCFAAIAIFSHNSFVDDEVVGEDSRVIQIINPFVIYVNGANSSLFPDGNSWATAYPTLSGAFEKGMVGKKEIWLAKGVYSVKRDVEMRKRFKPVSDAALYGGFSGNESLREQRNWKMNTTILSGLSWQEKEIFKNAYSIAFGKAVLNITLPRTDPTHMSTVPEIEIYLERAQCVMTPVP